jgi:hypothetical protein
MRTIMAIASFALGFSLSAHALYDGKPVAELRDAPGAWHGTLTYNDYSEPGKLVTLQTTAFVSLIQPNELAVFYVFDDGPGKTVYSYEQMRFDFAKAEVRWTSGAEKKEVTISHIDSNEPSGEGRRIVFATTAGDHVDRHTLTISAKKFVLRKDEIDHAGRSTMRDEYQFQRSGID